jgi:hypothetical protein
MTGVATLLLYFFTIDIPRGEDKDLEGLSAFVHEPHFTHEQRQRQTSSYPPIPTVPKQTYCRRIY